MAVFTENSPPFFKVLAFENIEIRGPKGVIPGGVSGPRAIYYVLYDKALTINHVD